MLDWEIQCHSLFAVLAIKGVVSTEGLRRSIENLNPRQYESWSYYEKWAAGMTDLLLEAVTTQELNEALFGTTTKLIDTSNVGESEPLFNIGDFVRVKSFQGQDGDGIGLRLEWRRPRIRVPGYIYGV